MDRAGRLRALAIAFLASVAWTIVSPTTAPADVAFQQGPDFYLFGSNPIVASLNRDADPDLVEPVIGHECADACGFVATYLGGAGATFRSGPFYDFGEVDWNPGPTAVGDFDGNGKQDLAVGFAPNRTR